MTNSIFNYACLQRLSSGWQKGLYGSNTTEVRPLSEQKMVQSSWLLKYCWSSIEVLDNCSPTWMYSNCQGWYYLFTLYYLILIILKCIYYYKSGFSHSYVPSDTWLINYSFLKYKMFLFFFIVFILLLDELWEIVEYKNNLLHKGYMTFTKLLTGVRLVID